MINIKINENSRAVWFTQYDRKQKGVIKLIVLNLSFEITACGTTKFGLAPDDTFAA